MALGVTPPTMTSQWPHLKSTTHDDEIDDVHHNNKVVSNSSMEKPVGLQQQQQQVALKCPRCDSSNTKFCYYNNYSLSQPRHFCKACKRYWTRGGTLRNVPVGGGCRKNKQQRLKRPSTTTIDSTTASSPSPSSARSQPQPHQIDATASTSNHHHHMNPLFYGLASNPSCDVNLPFSSRFSSSRIISRSSDLIQPQMNAIGLGFSSGVMSSGNEFRNGFTSSNNNNSKLFPSYSSIFSSSSTSTTTPVMMNNNSLLGSTLMMMPQQKLVNNAVRDDGPVGGNNITFHEGLVVAPQIEHVQMAMSADDDHSGGGGGDYVVTASKDVKVELGQNRLLELWNNNGASAGTAAANCQNQIEHHVMSLSSDPNSLYWNSTATAAAMGGSYWNDQPNNIGPSVSL